MTEMPTSEVLDLAADEIQRRGWVQQLNALGGDPWGLEGGPVCLEGGIAAVIGMPRLSTGRPNWSAFTRCPAYGAVVEYLDDARIKGELWAWNDAYGRTQEDVIAVLRAAAAVERSREDLALRAQANATLARAKEAAYAPEKVAA